MAWWWHGSDGISNTAGLSKEPCHRTVLKAITFNDLCPLTVGEIAGELKLSTTAGRAVVSKMVADGLLVARGESMSGARAYGITAAGMAAILPAPRETANAG